MKNTHDLIFANEPISVCDIDVKQPFSSSEHSQISFRIFVDNRETTDCTELTSSQLMYDWDKGDYENMSQFLMSVNWCNVLAYNLTVDPLWSAFYDILSTAIALYAPKKLPVKRSNAKRPHVYYPSGIRCAIARKRCLWHQVKTRPGNAEAAKRYRLAAEKCKQSIRNFEIKKEQKVIDSNNQGSFSGLSIKNQHAGRA